MKTKPFKYQKLAVRRIDALGGRAGLFLDMGLGKTLITLGSLYRNRKEAFPVVVVCPAAVKYQWEQTVEYELGLKTHVLEGRKPQKTKSDADVFIVNYEIIMGWWEWLSSHNIQSIVLDECQRVANRKNQCTKAVMKLSRGVHRRLALSGTPLQNRPKELFTVANWLRPDVFNSWWPFAQKFCAPKYESRFGWNFDGSSNLGILADLLERTLMIRYTKKQVLKDLPSKIRKVTTLPLSDLREYKTAQNDFERWLWKQDPAALRRASKAIALAKTQKLLQLVAKLKMDAVLDWVDNFFSLNPDDKLTLFFTHTEPLEMFREACRHRSVTVNGKVTGRKRQDAIDSFIQDPKVKVFLGNIQAAGTGVDGLQKVCRTAAFVQMDWRPGVNKQGEDRLYRIGQKHTTWIYYLLAHGTIEAKLAQALQSKQDVITSILDREEKAADTVDNLDLFDMLISQSLK